MNNNFNEAIKKINKISNRLVNLPFVRCVILNGSLAQGKFKDTSDIDLLIIAKNGRIFTTRFFVNIFLIFLGLKRSKDETKSHAGKFCVNYFLTEDFLIIPTGRGEKIDRYCAENYSQGLLIGGDSNLFKKFMKENDDFFSKFGFREANNQEIINILKKTKRFKIQKHIEKMLNGRLGHWLEEKLKVIQIKSIEKDPRTFKYPNLIVYNDKELRFHPPKKNVKSSSDRD